MKTWIVIYFGKVIATTKMNARLTSYEVERKLMEFYGFPKNALYVPDRRQQNR